MGIDEDPVNGSSHTVLGPYWASRGLGLREEGSDGSGAEGSSGGGAGGSSGAKRGGAKGNGKQGSVTVRSRVCSKRGGDLRVTVPMVVPLVVLGQGGQAPTKAPTKAIKARRNEGSPGDLWQVGGQEAEWCATYRAGGGGGGGGDEQGGGGGEGKSGNGGDATVKEAEVKAEPACVRIRGRAVVVMRGTLLVDMSSSL